MHICISKLTIIGLDNSLSPRWRQAILIQGNVFENIVCKMAAILSRPQCVNGLVLDYGNSSALPQSCTKRSSYSCLLSYGTIYHNIACYMAMIMVKYRSNFKLTKEIAIWFWGLLHYDVQWCQTTGMGFGRSILHIPIQIFKIIWNDSQKFPNT